MKKRWTTEEDELLTKNYAKNTVNQLCIMIPGRNECQIYNRAYKLGLKKDSDWLRDQNRTKVISAGIGTRFKKGQYVWNQGRTGIRVSIKSEFKKGNLPGNTKFDGFVTVRTDTKTGRKYKYVRVAKAKWELLHRKVWIDQNGLIPKGHIVAFKDNDTMNCDLSNLELMSMCENLRRNNKNSGWKKAYALQEKHELGQDPTGVKTLSDSYVAGLLSWGKKENKSKILQNSEIIELKRKQIQLNRALNSKNK